MRLPLTKPTKIWTQYYGTLSGFFWFVNSCRYEAVIEAMQVKNASEAMELLLDSARINKDLNRILEFESSNPFHAYLVIRGTNSFFCWLVNDLISTSWVLIDSLEFQVISPSLEFRGFVFNKKLTGRRSWPCWTVALNHVVTEHVIKKLAPTLRNSMYQPHPNSPRRSLSVLW